MGWDVLARLNDFVLEVVVTRKSARTRAWGELDTARCRFPVPTGGFVQMSHPTLKFFFAF